jgi:hypothetical protein
MEQAPYMAIITATHHVVDTPMDFVGEALPDTSTVIVSLYAAAFDPVLRQAVKQSLLSQHRMTQNQFAELISRTNYNDGAVATLTHLDKHRVNPLPERPKSELETATAHVLSGDEQFARFLSESIEDTEGLIEKGRANKSTLAEIAHRLQCAASNLASNKKFRIKSFEEVLQRRGVRALQSIQDTLRSVVNHTSAPDALPPPTGDECDVDAPVMFQISTGSSTSQPLFCAEQNQNVVSITLHTAQSAKTHDGYTSHLGLWRGMMSCLDYSRLLRTDGAEIPFTLSRFMNQSVEEVPDSHLGLHSAATQGIENDNIKSLVEQIMALQKQVSENAFRNKTTLAVLLSELKKLEAEYRACMEEYLPEVKSVLREMVDDERVRLATLVDESVLALPEDKRHAAKSKVTPLLRLTNGESPTK